MYGMVWYATKRGGGGGGVGNRGRETVIVTRERTAAMYILCFTN